MTKNMMTPVRILSGFFLLLTAVSSVHGQIDMLSGPINSTAHPNITIPVKVLCDFVFQENLSASQFSVTEEGIDVSPVTLSCVPNNSRQALSLAMVGDRRFSMPAWATVKMKSAYSGFVDGFKTWSGSPDKGNVFGDNAPALSMTANKLALKSAIAQLDNNSSFSLTVITNAINDLLANGGAGPRHFVITSCVDQPIFPTIPEVLALTAAYTNAKNAGVVFHTILVYTNPSIPFINDQVNLLLKQFAVSTGGLYFLCGNQSEMQNGYSALVNFIYTEINPCTLQYTSKIACPDGGTRRVIVTFTGCNGSVSDTLYYTAPNDPQLIRTATFSLSSDTVVGLQQQQLVLSINSPFSEFVLYPTSVTLLFDNTYLKLMSVATGGDIATGFTPVITQIVGGARIDFNGPPKLVPGSGEFCHLTFLAGDPDNDIIVPIAIQNVTFARGCLKNGGTTDGSLYIRARKPILTIDCLVQDAVRWDTTTSAYSPETFQASVDVSNIGNREAKNVTATILLPPGIELVSPGQTIILKPVTLDVGSTNTAQWVLRALERVTSDTLTICFNVSADNVPEIQCCKKIFIQERGPLLRATCASDVVVVTNNKYSPMPFTIRAEAINIGGMIAQPIRATITLPTGLSLATGEQATKQVAPSALRNNQKGSVSWLVTHPDTQVELFYDVVICYSAGNAAPVCCTLSVRIPPLQAPMMQTTCSAPDSLVFNASVSEYNPNPFTASVSTRNIGGIDATNVRAVIMLPSECVLDPSTQSDTIKFSPSIMQGNPNAAPVTASWQVRALRQSKRAVTFIRFRIVGDNFSEIDCVEQIILQKAGQSQVSCSLTMPDSLRISGGGSSYTPTPFPVNCTVRNTGTAASGVVRATIHLPAELQARSDTTQLVGIGWLFVNETRSLQWDIDALPHAASATERIFVTIEEDSIRVSSCIDSLFVPLLNARAAANCTSPDTIRFDRQQSTYIPNPFQVQVRVVNTGALALANVQATIVLPPELTLASGSETIPIAASIAPLQGVLSGWTLSVVPQPTSVRATITIRITSDGAPITECTRTIVIEGEAAAQLECSLELPPSIQFIGDRYQPHPFVAKVIVKNVGTAPVSNISALLLLPAELGLDASESAVKFVRAAALAPGDTVSTSFRVQVHAHSSTSIDTIRAGVYSSQTPLSFCEKTIRVEKALRPRFVITCSARDSIRFDASSQRYIPQTFTFRVSIKNVGDATAKVTYGLISVTGGLAINDAIMKFAPNALAQNDSTTMSWQITPLLLPTARHDTIVALIRTDEFGIVEARCVVPIAIEAANTPKLALACSMPDTIRLASGVYTPNPFSTRLTIYNNGNGIASNVRARITLPNGIVFAVPQNVTESLGTIDPNGIRQTVWSLSVQPRTFEELTRVCFIVTADNADSIECCAFILIEGPKRADVRLTCDQTISLTIDSSQRYSPDPFTIRTSIANHGIDAVSNLSAELYLPSGIDLAAGESATKLISPALIPPNGSGNASFLLRAQRRQTTDTLRVLIRVTDYKSINEICVVRVIVPGVAAQPAIVIGCTSTVDTVTYTVASGTSVPPLLNMTFPVLNKSGSILARAEATLSIHSPLAFRVGDDSTRSILNFVPDSAGIQVIQWNLIPQTRLTDTLVSVQFRLEVNGQTLATCQRWVYFRVQTDAPHVFMNEVALVVAGQSTDIPIWIDWRGYPIRRADIDIRYDSTILAFTSAALPRDMTNMWQSPTVTSSPGRISLRMNAIGEYTSSKPSIILSMHAFEFLPRHDFDIIISQIDIPNAVMNSNAVRATTDGDRIAISGRCARPLRAKENYQLFPTRPNPANPSTEIRFQLPAACAARVTIRDAFGRERACILDAQLSAGGHSLHFDASALASGMYFVVLETIDGALLRKFIVMK